MAKTPTETVQKQNKIIDIMTPGLRDRMNRNLNAKNN